MYHQAILGGLIPITPMTLLGLPVLTPLILMKSDGTTSELALIPHRIGVVIQRLHPIVPPTVHRPVSLAIGMPNAMDALRLYVGTTMAIPMAIDYSSMRKFSIVPEMPTVAGRMAPVGVPVLSMATTSTISGGSKPETIAVGKAVGAMCVASPLNHLISHPLPLSIQPMVTATAASPHGSRIGLFRVLPMTRRGN